MKSLDIRTIQLWVNQTQMVYLPEFSEILDISLDEWGSNLNILFQYELSSNHSFPSTDSKMFNIWIIDSKNIIPPPSDFYKFFGSFEKKFSEVNLATSNNGRVIPIDTITKYYIFVEEIKTVSENREEKLNEIL